MDISAACKLVRDGSELTGSNNLVSCGTKPIHPHRASKLHY